MERHVQYTLQVAVLISWLLGLFPTRNAFLTSKNFRFVGCSVGTGIAAATLVLSCFQIGGATYAFSVGTHTNSQASQLAIIFATFSALTYAALARFCSLIFCSKLVTLMRLLQEVRALRLPSGYGGVESRGRWKGWLTVGICIMLGIMIVSHVWAQAVAVITVDLSNPLAAMTLRREPYPIEIFVMIFGYSNAVMTEKVIVALSLCLGYNLLSAHEQISSILQYNLEISGTIMDYNYKGKDGKFWYSFMQVFDKLRTCFQIYTDVLGFQSFLIIAQNIGEVTYSTYFMLWPMDGNLSLLALPAALVNPTLILWIGNCMENQVKDYRQKIEDALSNARMRKHGDRSEVLGIMG